MYSSLPCSRLLIGVSGSIHAIQIVEYLVKFRQQFAAEIKVIMTPAAAAMVAPNTIELLTDGPVLIDVWGTDEVKSPHITLTQWAELFVVLPASANTIGKAANGIADNLLSTAILASPLPAVFAPAMNPAMWASAAVRRNVATLRADGHYVVEPGTGVSITTGRLSAGLVPSPATLLPHLWHVQLRRLKEAYWAEATAEAPRTPSASKTLIPVSDLLAGVRREPAEAVNR
jgi:phosphopantothenoylcysteine decarboxylase / phosphopantothenate---cysteine ligase